MSETYKDASVAIEDNGQYIIPLEIRPLREVKWYHSTLVRKRRLFGHRVVSRLIIDPETNSIGETVILSDDIDKQTDPSLRYALRFQDAAFAVGSFYHTPYMSSSHFVSVEASNSGAESTLVSESYTGITENGKDHFLENLKRFAPDYDGDYGKC